MKNYRICFYLDNTTDISHQVFVRANSKEFVVDKAKKHFKSRGIPQNELLYFTIECYDQGIIELVDLI